MATERVRVSRAGGNLVGGGGPAGDPGGSPWSVLETVPELFLETPMHLTFIFCEAPTKTTPPPHTCFHFSCRGPEPRPTTPRPGPGPAQAGPGLGRSAPVRQSKNVSCIPNKADYYSKNVSYKPKSLANHNYYYLSLGLLLGLSVRGDGVL